MAFLTIRIAERPGHERVALTNERTIIGRASACTIPIKLTSVSREHCAIFREGDDWTVEDLGSANGTLVAGERLAGRRVLHERDVIRIGKARLTFHTGDLAKAERKKIEHDPLAPPEAMRCGGCGTWLSTAHHLPDDSIACPRCQHANAVPEDA
jgi:pSer/pThr/pTyr-binding forkhead associated (FHA) protein